MKTFEERLKRLEEINGQIRDGEIDLKKSLTLFEEGIRLAKELEQELEKAEHTVEVLLEDDETAETSDTIDRTQEKKTPRKRSKKAGSAADESADADESPQLFDFGPEDQDMQQDTQKTQD